MYRWLLVCVLALSCVDGAKILGLFPFPSKSHTILGAALLKELANRGHEITMISPFPLENSHKNYRDINLDGIKELRDRTLKQFMQPNCSYYEKFTTMFKIMEIMNDVVLEHKEVIRFLADSPKYDIVIHMMILNEALLGIADKINATPIAFSVLGANTIINGITGNPNPYSYVPNFILPFSGKMSFLERTANTAIGLLGEFIIYVFVRPYQQRVLKRYFPHAPSLQELIDRVDISLINSHFSTETPRPYLPNAIQIGGFHLYEKEKVPEDIQTFLDNSKHGVIFFSLGTNVRSTDLPDDVINSFVAAFSKTKYDILWKFETTLINKPKNIKINTWMPQRAILDHPKTKVFITHGGLGSTVESVFYGVPMICIPFFGDQNKNSVESVKNGYAILLNLHEITEKSLSDAIREITDNIKYRETVKLRSDIYKNQPINPMDKAVYWVEHVIKHKGAKYLKSRATKLYWFQYMLLDVFAFIAAILLIVLAILYYTIKKICVYNHKIKRN